MLEYLHMREYIIAPILPYACKFDAQCTASHKLELLNVIVFLPSTWDLKL